MAVFAFFSKYSHSGGWMGALLRFCLRLLQFVLAVTVAGLYGIDLARAHDAGVPLDSKWVYAEVVAGLSALSCIIYGIPFFKSHIAAGWDWVIFVLWTALFGIFGKIYIPDNGVEQDANVVRMKHAVWVDAVNMALWSMSATYSTLICMRARKTAREMEKV